MKNFSTAAAELADSVRANGEGFMTMSKEEFRNHFDIAKLTYNQADEIQAALENIEVIALPHPYNIASTVRIFDLRHQLGAIALAIVDPENLTAGPLREAARVLSLRQAALEMRSEDVPWVESLGVLLELILGREPEGWEDVRNDRHSIGLAEDLARAMGIDPELLDRRWMLRLASSACPFRTHTIAFRAADIEEAGDQYEHVAEFEEAVRLFQAQIHEARAQLLEAAARMLLRGAQPPATRVELGLLGLRLRRERMV
jgi:hypothetical protein